MAERMLVRAKGIYDSVTATMHDTGLLVMDGKIRAIGTYEHLRETLAPDAVLDYREYYLLPGLINTHVHLEFKPSADTYAEYCREDDTARAARAERNANALLLSGVTTIRDAGSSMRLLQYMREWHANVPHIQAAGMPLTNAGGHLAFLGETVEEAAQMEEAVLKRKSAGCGCIKIIISGGQMTPGSLPECDTYGLEEVQAAVDAAHANGLLTVAHCLTASSVECAMSAGIDSVEHAAFFQRDRRTGLLARVYEPQRMEAFRGDHRFLMIGLSNNYHRLDAVRDRARPPGEAEQFLLQQEDRECAIFRSLTALGMMPVIGTDAGCGCTYFDETWLELELLHTRCGMSTQEVLQAATENGARALGCAATRGRLAPGYEADLIAVRENPLENIRTLRHVEHVVLHGQLIR